MEHPSARCATRTRTVCNVSFRPIRPGNPSLTDLQGNMGLDVVQADLAHFGPIVSVSYCFHNICWTLPLLQSPTHHYHSIQSYREVGFRISPQALATLQVLVRPRIDCMRARFCQ